MDELEILCWVNYLDQVNLLNLVYNVNDALEVANEAENTIFYMALSTKNLLNE